MPAKTERLMRKLTDGEGRTVGVITAKRGRFCVWENGEVRSLLGIFGSLEDAERLARALLKTGGKARG